MMCAVVLDKMKIWILITLLCLVLESFGSFIKEEKKYCTDDKDPDFRLAIGEQGPSPRGTCMLVKCRDVVEGKSVLTRIGCGVFVPSPGCTVVEAKTKLYPDCCPNEVCENQ